MFEAAVAPAMVGDVGRRLIPDRQGGRTPEFAGILVSDIDGLARPVGHRVVRPRRKLALSAVHGPKIAAAVRGDLEAEVWIGDDVNPRRWSRLARPEDDHVLLAAIRKPTESIEKLDIWRLASHLKRREGRLASRCGPGRDPHFGGPLELFRKPPSFADQYRARRRKQ